MELLLVAVILFFAVFVTSVAGFGLALVAMPFLILLVGLRVATPIIVLVGMLTGIFLIGRYKDEIDLKAVWKLVSASLLTIPLGILSIDYLNHAFLQGVLGIILIGYALYGLFELKLPELRHPAWAFGFGLVAGWLGGAFATSGPPVVIYGTCRRGGPQQFKGNLQTFFFVNGIYMLVSHAWHGNFTADVWQYFLVSLPGIALGFWSGLKMAVVLNPAKFRILVLWMLILLGVRMLV